MTPDDFDLQLDLGIRFKGIKEAQAYADAVQKAAEAEKRLDDVIRRSTASGPNNKARMAEWAYTRAKAKGASDSQLRDLEIAMRRAQQARDRANREGRTPAEEAADTLRTTRLNMGGASPLAGRLLDSVLGKDKSAQIFKMAGEFSAKWGGLIGVAIALAKAGAAAAEKLYQMADASARNTNALSSARVTTGGSVYDAARTRLYGSPDAARAFQERITTDPSAMGAAARVGIRNLKAPYGSMEFGRQYLAAIQRVAAIQDEGLRIREAYRLGIEQEVERYRLLSSKQRRILDGLAKQEAAFNDLAQRQRSANFEAAQTGYQKAVDNLNTVISKVFMDDLTAMINTAAVAIQTVGDYANKMTGFWRFLAHRGLDQLIPGLGTGLDLLGVSGGANKDIKDNTAATKEQTAAMNRLTQNIGLGQSGQRGAGVGYNFRAGDTRHNNEVLRSMAWDALG